VSFVLVLIVAGFMVGGLASSSWMGAWLGAGLMVGLVVAANALLYISRTGG
jgi:hypothetical protein